jgi:hypothetical protein
MFSFIDSVRGTVTPEVLNMNTPSHLLFISDLKPEKTPSAGATFNRFVAAAQQALGIALQDRHFAPGA